jgi:hypothetical protein
MATADETKVVGYFAYASSSDVFCDGDACVIAGSDADLNRYLSSLAVDDRRSLRPLITLITLIT